MLLTCHSLIDRIAIIRTVRDEAGNLAINLLKQPGNFAGVIGTVVGQGVRDDFASACVNRQMQLPPGPAATTVSFLIPFALSEQFQPGAVDDQVSGSVRDHIRPPITKTPATSAERGVIGDAEIELQQAKHTAGECLGLAQGKVKHRAQDQHHLDRQIEVDRLSARRDSPWCQPPVDSGLVRQQSARRPGIEMSVFQSPDLARIHPAMTDTGVYGLVLPQLSTVEDAQAAVAAARYPQVLGVQDLAPAGERGWGNRIASRYWGLTPQEYYDAADLWPLDPEGNILLMGIIEEVEGVQNIRDILRQVRGIGAIWAGPGDMSVSMGLRGQASHPAVQENLLRVLAACKEFGVPCATGATADDMAMRLEQGFRIIMTTLVRNTPGLVEGRRLAAR